ncbi:MAG: hypothetical protein AAFU03_12235, partial [Bacteroidota bacterium]
GGTFGRYEADGSITTIATIPDGLNGAGYNNQDGFVYAYSGNTLYRFHDDGTVDNLGVTAGLPGGIVVAGFDDNGNFYVKQGGDPPTLPIYLVDVTTNTATTIIPNAVFGASDWAFHPGMQTFYGVDGTTLFSFNPATNTVSSAPLTGVANQVYGGALYGANGYIYAVANSQGAVYKINVETLEGQQIINTGNASGLDGASCSTAMPPWAFICAENDEACAAEGVATEIPLLDNDIPTNTAIDNFSFFVIAPPTFGSVIFNNATGQAEYTPFGVPQDDQFTYRICGNTFPLTCDVATVTIIPAEPITFNDIGPYCQGEIAPSLPNASIENVNGNWFPPAVSTAFPGVTEYTFFPDPSGDPNVCYGEVVIEIEVIETLVPEFNIPDQFCQGDVVPSLPTLSDNFVSGTWDPSTINNQITRTYTFTPDAFFCADEIDLTITITPQDEPMFSFETQYCTGGTVDVLPTTSDDGITGTWNPAAIDDQNSGTYTFTPDGGQCATATDVMVTIGSTIDPTFTLIDEYCIGSTTEVLPTTSENGITGTWSPTTIDNQNSGSYTFTPDGGQCGEPFTLDVTISTNIIPGFNFQQQYCAGAAVDLLPGTSTN